MSEFLQRLENEIQFRCPLPREQKILVAVSGGLDSMTLLHALHKLSVKNKWNLTVAHFNHQLRGRSSDADEKLVCKTAAKLKLPVVVETANVKPFARKSKLSIEMAARKLRHEFFAKVARERKISVIALAHHADDQVELFFLRLLRGTGGEGLAGMKWRTPSPVDKKLTMIRPLLESSKSELLDFARENKIPFREDVTNYSSDFLRNRIRNELLPLLRKKYQSALNRTVLRLMGILGAESDLLGEMAQQWLLQRTPAFEKLSVAIQRKILQAQIVQLGVMPDFELIESLRKSANIAVNINPQFSLFRDLNGTVKLKAVALQNFNDDELILELKNKVGETIFGGIQFDWRFGLKKKMFFQKKSPDCEFFDADKVGDKITLRHWRPGDRFQPIGLKSGAKLQDLFTNAKIPRERRHDLIVATTADGEIFWVENLRMAEHFKLMPETKRHLIWRWKHVQSGGESALH